MADTRGAKLGYRPDIEGLRGLAVCLVVAFHSSEKWFHGGFIGVDVFFVISGYLITGILVREIEETGRLSLAGFYARRARRLLPASALVLLATILACSLLLTSSQQYRLGESASRTALYVSNFWFLRQSTDYFAPAIASNPFLHTWSLAVEEQFYLVWPTLVLLGLRGRRPRRTLLAIMILITAASLAICMRFTGTLGPWTFFSPFARGWEFAIGGITLLLATREVRGSGAFKALASWLGLAAILVIAVLAQGERGWPGWSALILVLGTAAILYSRVPHIGAARILELPVAQWIGRLSYSWYLWHWPLLALIVAMHPGLTPSKHFLAVLLCDAGSLGLAAATHTFFENPIRFSRYLAPRRVLSLSGAALVTVITAGGAITWQRSASLEQGRIAEATKAGPQDVCPAGDFLSTAVVECVAGNPASRFTAVLFGDSHAGQWFPAFAQIANDRGWRLVLIRKPACPTARVKPFNVFLNKPYSECEVWREAAIRRIIEIHPAVVVIVNRQLQTFEVGRNSWNDTWQAGSRDTLETLDSSNLNTILLRDTPAPPFNMPDCLDGASLWWARKRASAHNPCMLDRAKALNEGVFRAEQAAAAGLPHVHVVDLSDLFCDGAVCPPVKNGLIVYGDDSHITVSFARSIAAVVAGRLGPLISGVVSARTGFLPAAAWERPVP